VQFQVRGGRKSEIFGTDFRPLLSLRLLAKTSESATILQPTSTVVRYQLSTPHFLDFLPSFLASSSIGTNHTFELSERNATMSMNLFRLAGDMSHVFSIIVLLLRLRVVKNAAGKLGHHTSYCTIRATALCPTTTSLPYSAIFQPLTNLLTISISNVDRSFCAHT